MSQEDQDTERAILNHSLDTTQPGHYYRRDEPSDKTQYGSQTVLLFVLSHVEQVTLSEGQNVVVGRADKSLNFAPDIDLGQYNARKQGVSRSHARLSMRQGQIYVMDLNSNNGTILQGKALPPERPTLLSDGDHLRLGTMEITIQIQPVPAQTS